MKSMVLWITIPQCTQKYCTICVFEFVCGSCFVMWNVLFLFLFLVSCVLFYSKIYLHFVGAEFTLGLDYIIKCCFSLLLQNCKTVFSQQTVFIFGLCVISSTTIQFIQSEKKILIQIFLSIHIHFLFERQIENNNNNNNDKIIQRCRL